MFALYIFKEGWYINNLAIVLKERRQNLNLSLVDLENLSGVSKNTLLKIENEDHIPSVGTLLSLSTVLKTDLLKVLNPSYRLDNYFDVSDIAELEFMIEKMLDNNQHSNLPKVLEMLNDISDKIDDKDISVYLYQIILFLDGIYLNRNDKNYKLAYESFIEALALTIDNFDINNFESFTYNAFELRILMNIALTLNKLKQFDSSKKVFLFLLKNLDKKSQLYASTLHNLAIFKAKNKEYKQSLALINRAIDFSNKYRNSSKLHSTYYEKAIFEYRLGDQNYKNSFEISRSLAKACGYNDFLNFLEEEMQKYQ